MSSAQDAFLARRFGVFNHFLFQKPDGSDMVVPSPQAAQWWNECLERFDVKDMARRLHEAGAGYYMITLMQGGRYMLAPNAAYDEIAGTQPGEACARRDLVMELAEELAKYDIDLFLYYTGDGPYKDPDVGPRMGYADRDKPVTEAFVRNWAAVAREYSLRYGSRIKGWWVDGCYQSYLARYTEDLLTLLYDACKAGNPDALVAMNNGVKPDFLKYYSKEEFICGEFNDFQALPASRFIDGAQAHILAPLGKGENEPNEFGRWRCRGARRCKEYMLDYVRRANLAGMPVTIDVFVDTDGSWDPDQMEVLKYIGDNL